jgi:hypothetical protein
MNYPSAPSRCVSASSQHPAEPGGAIPNSPSAQGGLGASPSIPFEALSAGTAEGPQVTTRSCAVGRLAGALQAALGGTWRAEYVHDKGSQEVFLTDLANGLWAVAVVDPVGELIALAAGRSGQPAVQAASYAPEVGASAGFDTWLATADLDAPASAMAGALRTALEAHGNGPH